VIEATRTKQQNGATLGGDTKVTECGGNNGCGTVYEITPSGTKTVLHAFQGGSDGVEPNSGVIRDRNGNLYGTSGGGNGGANCPNGCGTVFKVAPDGTETVLYAFQAGSDGNGPVAGLLMDGTGNLYGTTIYGGGAAGCPFGPLGCGTVFKIAPDGTESVLYVFKGGSDGQFPEGGLIADKAGNLYGTTYDGGGPSCHGAGCGTVFKLAPDGTETVLYAFGKLHYGRNPTAALLAGKNGLLYGTASAGGSKNDGVVFSVTK